MNINDQVNISFGQNLHTTSIKFRKLTGCFEYLFTCVQEIHDKLLVTRCCERQNDTEIGTMASVLPNHKEASFERE